jgi:hypothetical protein
VKTRPRVSTVLLLATVVGCTEQDAPGPRTAAVLKGGDDRTGAYGPVAGWWKAAPDHVGEWTWGEVSGVAVDTPDRIIVAV